MLDLKTREYLASATRLARHNKKADGLPRMACILTTKDGMVHYGTNQRKTHPMQANWGRLDHHVYLHAEIDALVKAFRWSRKTGLQQFDAIYVARVGKLGEPRMAMPCEGCMAALLQFGVSNIFWTTNP